MCSLKVSIINRDSTVLYHQVVWLTTETESCEYDLLSLFSCMRCAVAALGPSGDGGPDNDLLDSSLDTPPMGGEVRQEKTRGREVRYEMTVSFCSAVVPIGRVWSLLGVAM